MKKIAAVVLVVCFAMFPLCMHTDAALQPRFTNIASVYLKASVPEKYVIAEMSAYSSMSLGISVEIYENGSYKTTLSQSNNGEECVLERNYSFQPGKTYRLVATYRAGSETTTRSETYNA